MKTLLMAIAVLFVASVGPVLADDTTKAAGSQAIDLGGSTPQTDTCVDVEAGGVTSSNLDCINQALKRQADKAQPVLNVAPIDATSPAVKVGGFNQTAMSQRYGQNWGKSVIPFRPAAPAPSGNILAPR